MNIKSTPGNWAPRFTLPSDDGTQVSLADFTGKRLVLFFYPKDNTPGCTTEAIDFSALKGEFDRHNTKIVGVSADSITRHQKFRAKHKLTVPLLSDETHTMLEAYGVWGEKKLYGKTYLGITRTTFLINEEGQISHIWQKVKVKNHANEVLETIANIDCN